MKNRTKRIESAIAEAKKRDQHCLVCGYHRTDGAHLLPRNVGFKKYDPACSENILSLCRKCHRAYDSNPTPETKIDWLMDHGLPLFAQRLHFLISSP